MIIGTGRIVLDYYNNDDASEKRRQLRKFCEDLRKKFNISAIEVADFDDPERCVIGFAAVIPESGSNPRDESSARALIEKISSEIDRTAFARVTIEDTDLLWHGECSDD